MEVRLNKLISDSGLCSRREADKFIEEGRVTVKPASYRAESNRSRYRHAG